MLLYQVDYHNEASGKRLAATKRRIVWRFGFANATALAEGQTGNNCRGEEHEVSVVWSLTSGKRQVSFDGREIHFGKSTEAKVEMSWTMQGGHAVKVLAHAAPPLRATPSPGFRQFDFLLDGLSYFDMPKIYELGTPAASSNSNRLRAAGAAARSAGSRGSSSRGSSDHYYSSPPRQGSSYSRRHDHDEDCESDQRYFASAPLPSVTPEKTSVAAAPAPSPPTRSASMPAVVVAAPAVETVDFLGGLNDASPAAPQQHQSQQQRAAYQAAAAPQHHHVGAPHPQYNGYHPQQGQPAHYHHQHQHQQQFQPQYAAAQARGVDEFAPVPPPPRTFQDVSKQILSNYGPDPNAPLALANAPHYDDHMYENSTSSALIADHAPHHVTPEKQGGPLTLRPTMEPVSIAELEAREHAQQYAMSDLERAMKSIVNLDDITETVETPEQAKQHRLKKEANNKPAGRSKPKPAVQPAWNLGLSPALKDIQEHATTQKSSEPTREIMRSSTHAFDPAAAQAGMMVLYGGSASVAATPPIPPHHHHAGIPSVQGFGATGVHVSHNNNYAAYHLQHQQHPHPHQQRQPQHVMYAAH